MSCLDRKPQKKADKHKLYIKLKLIFTCFTILIRQQYSKIIFLVIHNLSFFRKYFRKLHINHQLQLQYWCAYGLVVKYIWHPSLKIMSECHVA